MVGTLTIIGRFWVRRLTSVLTVPGTFALGLVFALALTGFWLRAWQPTTDAVSQAFSGDAALEAALFGTMLVSFFMICSLVRVTMLAFDHVSTDLRIIVERAPLGRLRRAAIYVLPDYLVTAAACLLFGSLALLVFAASSSSVGVPEVIVWSLALVLVAGALSASCEWLFLKLTGAPMASRGGAAMVLLVGSGGLTGFLANEFSSQAGLDGRAVSLFGDWLALGGLASVGLAIVVGAAAASLWIASSSFTGQEVFRSAHHRRWLSPADFGLVRLSALGVLRDPNVRLGFLAILGLVIFFEWFDSLVGLGLAAPLSLWLLVFVATVVSITAYGEYLEVRWRVMASPASPSKTLLHWLGGHFLAGLGAPALVLAVLWAFRHRSELGAAVDNGPTLAIAFLVGIGSGVLAGRLLPYKQEDVIAMATAGVLTACLSLPPIAALYYLIPSWLEPGTVYASFCWLVALVGGVVWFEDRRRRVPQT